jgi:hypothetical protein
MGCRTFWAPHPECAFMHIDATHPRFVGLSHPQVLSNYALKDKQRAIGLKVSAISPTNQAGISL